MEKYWVDNDIINTNLELKPVNKYLVDNNNDNCDCNGDLSTICKCICCNIIIIQVKSDVRWMESNNDNKYINTNTCYNFYLYSNCPDNVDTCWYYFVK